MNQDTITVLPPELSDPLAEHTLIVPPREEPTLHVEESPDEIDETVTKPTGRPLDTFVAVSVSVLVTGVVAGGAFVSGSYNQPSQTASVAALPAVVEVVAVPEVRNPYYGITLEARAAVVYDVYEDVMLFAQNETSKRSLASLTKIMTGVVASEHAKTQERVAVSPYAIETEGDSGLFANETWKLKDLISFVLMTSSNDGADALATAVGAASQTASSTSASDAIDVFVQTMNQKARDLELADTTFTNPTGLDEVGGAYGGEGTAQDMAKLIAYAWKHFPETLADSTELHRTFTSEDGFIHEANNTNKQVYTYPGLLGSKTGYTDYAGGNLAVVYDAGLNHPIVIVVLGSTLEGRFSDVKTLIDATSVYMESGWYAFEAEHLDGVR